MRFDLAEQLQEAWVQNFTCLIARLNIFSWNFLSGQFFTCPNCQVTHFLLKRFNGPPFYLSYCQVTHFIFVLGTFYLAKFLLQSSYLFSLTSLVEDQAALYWIGRGLHTQLNLYLR